MEKSPLLLAETNNYISKYGDVPPHWIFKPDSHPYSIEWRQGSGETFVEVFNSWFEENYKTVDQRILYFKKYAPPPRWLAMVIDSIWDLEGWNEPLFNYSPYLKKLEELGFDNTSDYAKDLDDKKWLDKYW